jgi:FkbM family methyltransferase
MGFYGQFDTDRYISEYFPLNYKGTCVDIGMGEPINGSNTYWFENRGWKCLCVEPNLKYVRQAQGIRLNVEHLACGAVDVDDQPFTIINLIGDNESAISSLKIDDRLVQDHRHLINYALSKTINVRKLDTILAMHPEITQIDFISIDTENTELDVLKGWDINRWAPKLMVIENNYDEPFISAYLADFGYVRDKRIKVNDFYIKQ